MRKKIVSLLLSCIMACAMFAMPVAAAEVIPSNDTAATAIEIMPMAAGTFSGITGKMNSLNGLESAPWNISSGSIGSTAKVTGVSVNVTVSSGSSAFYLYVEDPSGYWDYVRVGSSGTYNFTSFNNRNAYGTWKVSIQTTGTVSTATATLKVSYN